MKKGPAGAPFACLSRLRSQLDLRPDNGFIVTAVYGMGYRFEAVKPKSEDALIST